MHHNRSPKLSLSQSASAVVEVRGNITKSSWIYLIALSSGHLAVDCCAGIWPLYKTLAQLDLTKAGFIATVSGMAGSSLQIVFGILADRGSRDRLLVIGLLLSGSVTLVPWAGSYTWLTALMLATSIGSAAFHPCGAGAAASISPARTGSMIGFYLAGGYIGYGLSQLVFSVIYRISASATPVLFALPLCVAAAIAYLAPHRTVEAEQTEKIGSPTQTRQKWIPLAILFFIQVFAASITQSLIFLLPDLMQARNASAWMVNGGAHFVLILGGCLSLLPAGYASDRWGSRRILLFANLSSGILLLALLIRDSASTIDLAIVALFGAFIGINNVVTIARGNQMFSVRTGVVNALLMGLPWFFSAAAPVIAGTLADPLLGGNPVIALAWLGLTIPIALIFCLFVRDQGDDGDGPAQGDDGDGPA